MKKAFTVNFLGKKPQAKEPGVGSPGVQQDRNLHQETSMSMLSESFGDNAHHPLHVWMLACPHGVRREVTKTMPMAQQLPAGQMAGFDLLGVHR